MVLRNIYLLDYEDMPESRPRPDPWKVEPKLTRTGTLSEVLQHNFASVLAAHVFATVPGACLSDVVRYQPAYKLGQAGRSKIKDLEYRGIIYREFQGLIYTKRVGS